MPIPEEINNHDWGFFFHDYTQVPTELTILDYRVYRRSTKDVSFCREDVVAVILIINGIEVTPKYEWYDIAHEWLGIFKLRNGRYAFLRVSVRDRGYQPYNWSGRSIVCDNLELLAEHGFDPIERSIVPRGIQFSGLAE
jgi:hypothetical protein